MATSLHQSVRQLKGRRAAVGRPGRRLAAVAAALVCVLAVTACGDDDDAPGEPEAPAPTGANQSPEGNVDVTSSIADPDVAASNLGNLDGQAPFNS